VACTNGSNRLQSAVEMSHTARRIQRGIGFGFVKHIDGPKLVTS